MVVYKLDILEKLDPALDIEQDLELGHLGL